MRAASPLPGLEDDAPKKPAGGYRLIPVLQLAMAWWCYRAGLIRRADLRAYFACHELAARRGPAVGAGPPARFHPGELARLAGLSPRRAKAALARLGRAGLLRWSEPAIAFAESPDALAAPDLSGFWAMYRAIRNRRRRVPVPRRILRFLAGGARPVLIATVLGHLFRCLYVRSGRCRGRGRCKARWIARTFGVDLRRVKAARKELVALGWLIPGPSPQWALNRWGKVVRVNLAWRGPSAPGSSPAAGPPGPGLPPPPAAPGPGLPPPDSDREPLQEFEHQEPAPGGPAGACIHPTEGEEPAAPAPPLTSMPARGTPPGPPAAGPPPAAPPPPTLRAVRIEDLEDTGRALELYRQAVAEGAMAASEADRLRFVAAAEHARAVGVENPCGLFVRLVRGRLWRFLTQDDEDAANARLKRHLHGGPRPPSGPSPPAAPPAAPRPAPSADARLVAAVVGAARRAGYRGEAFYLLKRGRPEWTRERWDRALAELGGSGPPPRPRGMASPGAPSPAPSGRGEGAPRRMTTGG